VSSRPDGRSSEDKTLFPVGHFGKYIRNTLVVLKHCAGKRWRRSFVLIMRKIKKYYIESRKRKISCIQ
jgi:hypothetical protein